jgi:hypothetical protein
MLPGLFHESTTARLGAYGSGNLPHPIPVQLRLIYSKRRSALWLALRQRVIVFPSNR